MRKLALLLALLVVSVLSVGGNAGAQTRTIDVSGAAIADTLAAHIPGAKKVVIPNAGHGARFAQPASFNSALMDFFFDVERNKRK